MVLYDRSWLFQSPFAYVSYRIRNQDLPSLWEWCCSSGWCSFLHVPFLFCTAPTCPHSVALGHTRGCRDDVVLAFTTTIFVPIHRHSVCSFIKCSFCYHTSVEDSDPEHFFLLDRVNWAHTKHINMLVIPRICWKYFPHALIQVLQNAAIFIAILAIEGEHR